MCSEAWYLEWPLATPVVFSADVFHLACTRGSHLQRGEWETGKMLPWDQPHPHLRVLRSLHTWLPLLGDTSSEHTPCPVHLWAFGSLYVGLVL